MKNIKWINLVVLAILVAGAAFRLKAYGDLRLSVGTRDSEDYIQASRAPLFSWESFTGKRLFGTNVLFKLARANGPECDLSIVSKPAENNEAFRGIQPCFDRVVLIQNILSVLCWCALGWLFANRMKGAFTKILSALLIMVFAFSPQIAEWDSVLSSESLTFSLFALSFGLLIEIVLRIAEDGGEIKKATIALTVFFILVFGLWTFERDANLYTTPVTLLMLLPLLFFKPLRKSKYLVVISAILILFLFIGLASSSQSVRWHITLDNIFQLHIFPYPARMEFFQKLGMPDPQSAEYAAWRDSNAPRVYLLFLVSHPGFVASTMWANFAYFTTGHIQPYFVPKELPYRDTLVTIGQLVHPETGVVYLLDVILVLSLCILAWKKRDAITIAWTWLAIWFFLSTALTLFMNFFGDVSGALRHVTPPVAMFRLMIWVLLLVHLDLEAMRHDQLQGQTGAARS